MAENEPEEEKNMETLEERVDLDALKERVDKLEDIVEKGVKEMEAFASEKPMYAMSIALLGGVFVGFLIGAAVSRRGS
jgi:hypothetical protein